MKKQRHIAIVGAGMAGAAAAAELRQHGMMVTVFEKSRGAGGRMSSKRTSYGPLDFGAQYFTARSPKFIKQTESWLQQGHAAPWAFTPYVWDGHRLHASADQQTRYVGIPSMHAPIKALLNDVVLHTETRISECDYQQSNDSSAQQAQWQLTSSDGAMYCGFDGLVITTPLAQAKQLIALPELHALPDSLMAPCWALQLVTERTLDVPIQGIFVQQGPLRWVSCQSAKPSRHVSGRQIWLVHFTAEFSQANLDIDIQELKALACLELERMFGHALQVDDMFAQRWMYATINDTIINDTFPAHGVLTDMSRQLVIAGDWCAGGRIENAYLTGIQAAHCWIGQQEDDNKED